MSTLRTSNLIHGSSSVSNVVLDTSGRALFGPDGPNGRAALYVNPQTNRVGVNTESPAVALDVDGAINTTGDINVGGTLNLTNALVINTLNASSGTAAAPSVSVGTTDNGLYSPGTDQVAISTNGTERLQVDSSGNLGIGTSSPSANVHLVTSGAGEFRHADGTRATVLGSNGSIGFVGSRTAGNGFAFYSANSEAMRIDSSGRLLVGTPSSRGVGGSAAAELQVEITGSKRCASFVRNGSTPILSLGCTGATGIGDTTLVASSSSLGRIEFCGADGTNLHTSGAYIFAAVDGTPGANDMPGRLVFSTTADGAAVPTERMRIDSTGAIVLPNGSPGIKFGTVSSPATSTNLDDYEEGNWTPAVNGGTVGSDSWGKYIKIGHRVDLFFKVSISTMDNSSSPFAITGIPYIPITVTSGGFTGSCMTNNISFQQTSNTAVVAYQSNGTGGIRLYSLGNNVTWRSLRRIEVNAADQIYGTSSFITN